MLHLHFSNRYEVLTQRLLQQLDGPGRGVFAADQVIVPSTAVQRSLTLAMAQAHGICANVEFSYLAPWLWRQMSSLLPDVAPESPFVPAVLTWRVHAALGDAAFVSPHPRLAAYLGGADDVMRFELASRIAGLLDQYITYRPDWLEAWRQGRPAPVGAGAEGGHADERWQAALWQRLTAAADAPVLASGAAFIEVLQRIGPAQAREAGLPASAHVFVLPTMPALQIAWLQQIGRLVDVHVYVLNPCQEYWFELIDRRRLSHLAVLGGAEHQEEGNRLLAAWGRQTQAHVDGLVDSAGPGITDDADFRRSGGDTLLAQVQDSILELTELSPGSVQLGSDDRSLEVHVCHSLTRELEVLQDHLLGLIASGVVQHPSQILVVTPDLDAAAPLIEAVFGTAPRERHLPYTVSGRARSTVNAPARALLALLALVASRFSATSVFALLQQDVVARHFGLGGDALQQVHDWLRSSGTRWGLDAPHRAGFGVPGTTGHTWADGMDRLFLGYALPTQVMAPFADLLPAGDAEGSDAVALGALWQFVDQLRALHLAVASPRPPASWRALLQGTVEAFMAPLGDEIEDQRELLAAIRTLCDTMQRGGLDDAGALPLPLSVVRAALEQQLDDPARGGVPTGGITFSSMSSLRSLPFAVICAIGLDDGVFPTAQRQPEFDLMALAPRRGDRQRRTDERNLFLDLLLAARQALYLSYTGRSVRDNAPLPPSVLVSELLDLLVPAIADDPASPDCLALARRRLVVEHPLQPFSIEAFDVGGDPRLRSFDGELAAALRSSLQAAPVPVMPEQADGSDDEGDDSPGDDDETAPAALPAFFAGPLPPPGPEWREVSVEQLVEFFGNPCRYLLRRRLGIDLGRSADELQDDEPFLPDWPGRTALAARLLGPILGGAEAQAVRQLALAGHEMPSGALGRQQLDRELESLTAFAGALRAHTADPVLPPHAVRLALDIDGEAWQLVGRFADLRPEGLVRWRYDNRRASDVLAAWISHLVLCTAPPAGVAPQTLWLSLDAPLRLAMPAQPSALLHDLVRLYRRGLCEPLAFYPKSAWSFVESGGSINRANQTWTPTRDRPHAEGADGAYRLALRGRGDALDGEFAALAVRVFGPVCSPAAGAQGSEA
ncbi:MAG: exodeoxyribonuclease V subunit gamma [Rubrivivax sp.]|nr:exodeoxyribonuclease V subunit gamma [Rubrivivax sp.]